MAGINLRGETSGSVEITSPAVAGDTTITLPTTNGTLVVEQTDRVSFASSVGIGTDNPTQNLEINNVTGGASLLIRTSPSVSGGNLLFGDDASDTSGRVGYRHSSDYMFFSTNGGEKLRIEADGDLRISNDDAATNYGGIRGWDASTGNMILDADKSATGSAGSNLIIRCRGTEKLRVQNNGRVGINTDVPAHMLVLHTVSTTGYSTATGDTANTNTLLHLENQNGNDGAGVDNYVAAKFGVGRGATSQGWLGYTRTGDNQGAFFIKQRNAASSYPETIRFPSSGGITFGGGANAANTLDDYEEGTFTPVFANASSGGTESSSYTTQTGRYTKIGHLVHIDIYLKNVDTTSLGTGQFFIRGLPFSIKSGSIHIGAAGLSDVDLNSTASALYSFANATGGALSSIRVFQSKDNTGHSAIPCDAVNDGDNEIFVTMTYPTDS